MKKEKYYKTLRKNGLFCGECHCHINYPQNPKAVRKYLKENGIDYLSLCQGWLTNPRQSIGHDGKKLAKFLRSFSDRTVHIRMGAEFPKTRFGHVCWWRFPHISDPFGVYMNYHDTDYFKIAGISNDKIKNPSDEIPYSNESPLLKVARWKKLGGITMSPHPTSWWLENKNSDLICTNISVDFCLDLLTHRFYDTLVVMGYDAEQIFYQNFWFQLLNMGYKINAVAETDGDLTSHHKIGSLRTYASCNSPYFSEDKFLTAIKNGNTFLTSGPVIFANTSGGKIPGDIIICDGQKEEINFTVYSSPEKEEYISWVVIYKNGRPIKIFDIETKRSREFSGKLSLNTPDKKNLDWYIIKAYGSTRPEKKEFLDILRYCKLCEKEIHTEYRNIKQLAITNPFYFYAKDYKEPEPIKSAFSLRLTDKNSRPIENAEIKIIEPDSEKKLFSNKNGLVSLKKISPLAEILISHPNYTTKFFSIYLDYTPLKKYMENIYSGKWAFKNKNLQPGQVPFSVFDIKNLIGILSEINIKISLEEKEDKQ